jgi:Na+/melibiose symporter-like transporter
MESAIAGRINKAKGGQLVGFSFNNASTNAVFILISLYFLVYCTEVYGLPAVLVGAIMTGTRLFDAFTDPIIGLLIDRTDTRFGRFRPWIAGGAVISAAMIVLMFSGIKTGSDLGNIVLLITIYSIWVIGYTMQTACTKSGQNIMTSVTKQRSLINALGGVFMIPIYLLAVAAVLPILDDVGGITSGRAWMFISIIFAAIQILFALFVVLGMKKKDIPENYLKLESTEKPRFRDYISIFKNNRALQMLIVAASTNKITQTMQGGLTVLFYFYVAKNQALQSSVSTLTMPVMLIASFIMIPLITKFGRKETFTFSSWGGFIFGAAAIFLVSINPSSMIWLVLIMGVNWLLIAGAQDINIISMIADSADYEYYRNHRFIPGMIGTAFSFIDKVISSFGTLIIGWVLTGIGFVSITATPQTPKMFWVILSMYFGLPAFGHFCSIIAMRFYPLDRKTHIRMNEELAERNSLKQTV